MPHRKTKDGNNFSLSAKVRDKLEKKYGLVQDNNPLVNGGGGVKVSDSHFKTKIQAVRDEIDNVLERGSRKGLGLPVFIDELSARGIGCLVRLNGTEVSGLSYSLGTNHFSGSSLGIGYSLPELEKRGVTFRPERHLDDVLYANQREQSVSQIIENGYRNIQLEDEQVSLNQHYLIEPVYSEDAKLSEQIGLCKYRVFNLSTQIADSTNRIKSKIERRLMLLCEIRKNLYSIYDFIYKFSTMKLDSVLNYTRNRRSNLRFMFEKPDYDAVLSDFVNDPSNKYCLDKVGFILISLDKFKSEARGVEYALASAASRQRSIEGGGKQSNANKFYESDLNY